MKRTTILCVSVLLLFSLGTLGLIVFGAARLFVFANTALAPLGRLFVRWRARRLGKRRFFRHRRRRARFAAGATLGNVTLLCQNGLFQLDEFLGVQLVPNSAAIANVGRRKSVVDNVNRMFQAVGPFDSGALDGNKIAVDRKVLEAVDLATKTFVHNLLQIEILICDLKLQRAYNFVSYRNINIKLRNRACKCEKEEEEEEEDKQFNSTILLTEIEHEWC